MKRIVCVCNTYYQLLMAMSLRQSLFEHDYMSLILTDHSNNAKDVSRKLKEEKVFDDVKYAEVKELDQGKHDWAQAMGAIVAIVQGSIYRRYDYIGDEPFDILLYYNESVFVSMLFSKLNGKVPNLQVARLEEGILSYGNIPSINKRQTLAYRIRKIIGKNNISDLTNLFYCVYPEYYPGNLRTERIPLNFKSEAQILPLIKRIFLEGKNISPYRQKYIFFTSVYDFEGGEPIGEFDLVCKIADVVGKENILVKIHPRDYRTVYQDAGFAVDKNSSVPWEIIQLSYDFDHCTFLTVNSGAILLGNAVSSDPVSSYFLYKLCDYQKNQCCVASVKDIEGLFKNAEMRKVFKTVHVASSIEDIL